MWSLTFSMLMQQFSTFWESRKPTPPIEALIEFSVHEVVTKICLKRFSCKVSLWEILCSWRQIRSSWYLSAKYAISYFLDMESNVLALKVLIRNGVLIFINFLALSLATSDLILPDGFNTRTIKCSSCKILCRGLNPGAVLLSCHLFDYCVKCGRISYTTACWSG